MAAVFLVVVFSCYASAAAERSLARVRLTVRQSIHLEGGTRPLVLQAAEGECGGGHSVGDPRVRSLAVDEQPDVSLTDPQRAWLRRAGLYAIFCTQSNDFALGLPLFQVGSP